MRVRLDFPHPRQLEPAVLDHNAANLLEKFGLGAHANDRLVDLAQYGVQAGQAADFRFLPDALGNIAENDRGGGSLVIDKRNGSHLHIQNSAIQSHDLLGGERHGTPLLDSLDAAGNQRVAIGVIKFPRGLPKELAFILCPEDPKRGGVQEDNPAAAIDIDRIGRMVDQVAVFLFAHPQRTAHPVEFQGHAAGEKIKQEPREKDK